MKQVGWESGATGFLMAGGKSLEYACFGPDPASAPTIVMLHEGLGSLGLWRDTPQRIADLTSHGVFVYSRAGHGGSDLTDLPRPLDYMTIEATEILPEVLNGVGISSAILLGHSDGATIAAIYAGSVEDYRIRGLILMAPHFFTEKMGLEAIERSLEEYKNGDLKDRLSRHHADVENTFMGWNSAWLDPDFGEWNVSEVIDYLRIPVLAIQGVEDQYGTSAQIDEIESRIYSPLEIVMLEDCKHAPHIDSPELTMQAISEFTARLSRMENEVVKIA
jgi:pimeloyl-ACP methyl ester carboxylesterase